MGLARWPVAPWPGKKSPDLSQRHPLVYFDMNVQDASLWRYSLVTDEQRFLPRRGVVPELTEHNKVEENCSDLPQGQSEKERK